MGACPGVPEHADLAALCLCSSPCSGPFLLHLCGLPLAPHVLLCPQCSLLAPPALIPLVLLASEDDGHWELPAQASFAVFTLTQQRGAEKL